MVHKVALSYSGGKDSNLTLYKISQDTNYEVSVLVTFIPANQTTFLAHNLELIKLQAEALQLPHVILEILDTPSYLESYQKQIRYLKETYQIDSLVTGDVLQVCSNFMERAVDNTGVELLRPLWGCESSILLSELFEAKFQVYITCIDKTKVSNAEKWVGKMLNYQVLNNLNDRINMLGEFGEYHTMCFYSPLYKMDFLELIKAKGIDLPTLEYMNNLDTPITDKVKTSECEKFVYWKF